MRSGLQLTSLAFLVAVLLGVPLLPIGGTVGTPVSPSAPGGGLASESPVARTSQSPAFGPPPGSPTPAATPSDTSLRNLVVDTPCGNISNHQPDEAYDAASGILYEVWIGCGGIGFTRSFDGGYSFQPAYRVPGSVPPISNTTLAGSAWDPDIALAPNGTVYVAYMAGFIDGFLPGAQPVVAWSWNHGASFQGYANITHWTNATYNDRESIAVAPNGTVDVTWDYSPNNSLTSAGITVDRMNCQTDTSCSFGSGDYNIVLSTSTDGGRTWSAPRPVSPGYPNGGATTAELAVDSTGTLDVLFQAYNSTGPPYFYLGVASEYFTRSLDGGASWTSPSLLSNQSYTKYVWWVDGDLDIAPNGTLYAAFSTTAPGNLSTPWVTSSTDGGSTWSAPLAIGPTVYQSYYLDLAVAGEPGGNAYVAWVSNNSTGGSYSVYGELTQGYGTAAGPIESLTNFTGVVTVWPGNTVGALWLGGTAVAISFSLGIYYAPSGSVRGQILFTMVGLPPPAFAPTILSVVPGEAAATVAWSVPLGNSTITGYLLSWSIEGNPEGSVAATPSSLSAIALPLVPSAHYRFAVAAFNGAGLGVPSGLSNLTLSAWTVFEGTLTPATGQVVFDGVPVPLVGGAYRENTTFTAHAMSASATDYATAVAVVTPSWNGTVWYNFTLVLLPSVVRGVVFPVSSVVLWDGTELPVSAAGTYSTAADADSTHSLAVSFSGFISQTRTFTVPANVTLWQNFTLLADLATLLLSIQPSTGTVKVNDSPVVLNASGAASIQLSAGTYPVEVTATGYQSYFDNVTLFPGVTTNVSLALVRATGTPPSNGTGPSRGFAFLTNAGLPLLGLVLLLVLVGTAALAVWVRRRERKNRPPPIPPDKSALDRERQLADRKPIPESIR